MVGFGVVWCGGAVAACADDTCFQDNKRGCVYSSHICIACTRSTIIHNNLLS